MTVRRTDKTISYLILEFTDTIGNTTPRSQPESWVHSHAFAPRALQYGTRLKVTALHQNCVQATVLYGPKSGSQVLIPRVKLAPNDVKLPFTLERYQYPMRLAYSLLIRHMDRHSRRLVYFCQSLSLHMVSYKLHFQELERLVMLKQGCRRP